MSIPYHIRGRDYLGEAFEIRADGEAHIIYREWPGTGHWYRVSLEDVAHLGRMIADGAEDIYSRWSAESDAEQIDGPPPTGGGLGNTQEDRYVS